jgi:glycerol-3-phosphate dehydrogenase (NAD(P)+)
MSEHNSQRVGVIGVGSFGTAIANLLAYNTDVLVFSRKQQVVDKINNKHRHFDIDLSPRIKATNSLETISKECTLIFPMVPSSKFRVMMKNLGPYLRPYHILIHGTKGFDLRNIELKDIENKHASLADICTMTEVIKQESSVERVGCLSGPNLASEIMAGQPTATVIASHFDEVINLGKKMLNSKHFHVFGSHDLLGAELAGALKNVIALGSGILRGHGLGKNIQAMLISRGLGEMIHFGKKIGAESSAFLGTAGIGDLVATATSKSSRNFTFGYRLGKGESLEDINRTTTELAEGVRTLIITNYLAIHFNLAVPITRMLYKVVYEGYPIERAIEFLMRYPYDIDVDFILKAKS